jgi:hypothetical protein
MNSAEQNNQRLLSLIQETGDELDIAHHLVSISQFKKYALPVLEEQGLTALHTRIKKSSARSFNAFRDHYVKAVVTPGEVEVESDFQPASISRYNHKIEVKDALFFQQLEGVLTRSFKNYRPPPPSALALKAFKSKTPIDRAVTLFISDTHFGSDLDPRELPLAYGVVEEARRLAKIVREAGDFKRQYRDRTTLNINLGGDIMQGQLHDLRDGAPLAEQMNRSIYLLEMAVKYLAQEYPRGVVVRCTPGNHGRNKIRHKKRATAQKWDALETAIYYAVYRATKHLPNVRWEIPLTPYVSYETLGKFNFLTHGDTVLEVGYPGGTINVKAIQSQVNKINEAEKFEGRKHSVFMVGHVHIGTAIRLQGNKRVLVTNGCLIPPDGFATSKGMFDGNCGQSIWESVEGHPFGDYRFLEVDATTDKDASLDKIIPPWTGMPV